MLLLDHDDNNEEGNDEEVVGVIVGTRDGYIGV